MAKGKTQEEEITELMKFVDRAIEVAASRNELSVSLKGPRGEFTRAYAELNRSTKVPQAIVDRLQAAGFDARIGIDTSKLSAEDSSMLHISWSDA